MFYDLAIIGGTAVSGERSFVCDIFVIKGKIVLIKEKKSKKDGGNRNRSRPEEKSRKEEKEKKGKPCGQTGLRPAEPDLRGHIARRACLVPAESASGHGRRVRRYRADGRKHEPGFPAG